jgi:hypothetical protein
MFASIYQIEDKNTNSYDKWTFTAESQWEELTKRELLLMQTDYTTIGQIQFKESSIDAKLSKEVKN